jgi:hypothetical protein
MAMLPGVVEVIVRVVRAAVVADPVIAVDMRRVGMAGLVGEVAIFMRLRCAVIWLRSACGRSVHLMTAASGLASFGMAASGRMLCQHGECEERRNGKARDR